MAGRRRISWTDGRHPADYVISSPLMSSDYERLVPNYEGCLARQIAPAQEPLPPAPKEPAGDAPLA